LINAKRKKSTKINVQNYPIENETVSSIKNQKSKMVNRQSKIKNQKSKMISW